MFNEPRNAAVYLMRKIRRDRLKEIGELFGIGKYSSVSSMIEGIKQRLKTDRSFRKRINDLYRSIINSQKQTWPLLIHLDGADTPIVHIVNGIPVDKIQVGLKVKAVFAEKTTATIMDIDHFAPVWPAWIFK